MHWCLQVLNRGCPSRWISAHPTFDQLGGQAVIQYRRRHARRSLTRDSFSSKRRATRWLDSGGPPPWTSAHPTWTAAGGRTPRQRSKFWPPPPPPHHPTEKSASFFILSAVNPPTCVFIFLLRFVYLSFLCFRNVGPYLITEDQQFRLS